MKFPFFDKNCLVFMFYWGNWDSSRIKSLGNKVKRGRKYIVILKTLEKP